MRARRHCLAAAAATAVLAVSGTACSSSDTAPADAAAPSTTTSASASSASNPPGPEPTGPGPDLLPGMPPPLSPTDVYAADHTLSPAVAGAKALVYVPNTKDNTVTVIDQASMAVIGRFPLGPEPQHVVPSYDLTALYVASDLVSAGGSLTPIDPTTGTPGHRFRWPTPKTCTSPPMVTRRSSWPRNSNGWTSTTRTPGRCSSPFPSRNARGSTNGLHRRRHDVAGQLRVRGRHDGHGRRLEGGAPDHRVASTP